MQSNQEILERAITRAINGGWSPLDATQHSHTYLWFGIDAAVETDKFADFLLKGDGDTPRDMYKLFIFNHDFAKALWGEKPLVNFFKDKHGDNSDNQLTLPAYKAHLARMVIAEDPIKYLGENL
jgi:hypothetical protein